ncbi:MAG: hypothetical protein FJ134_08070 [Deltaproteobacteria bacterium]|nr:hypothetical protein [Deltaproteobacteria bacterium]
MKDKIHALEFSCQSPLRFYERCSSCPRFKEDCPDLKLGVEILRGKTKLAYGANGAVDQVHVSAFNCLAPLYYFEKTRSNCAHQGRCREEGLLLALLTGKKTLDCSEKQVISLPARKARGPQEVAAAKAAAKK